MSVVLLVISLVCLVFASFGFSPSDDLHMGWLGLSFFVAAVLVGAGTAWPWSRREG